MGSATRIHLHLLDLTKGISVPSTLVQAESANVRTQQQQQEMHSKLPFSFLINLFNMGTVRIN